jgi:hypothetical protein
MGKHFIYQSDKLVLKSKARQTLIINDITIPIPIPIAHLITFTACLVLKITFCNSPKILFSSGVYAS